MKRFVLTLSFAAACVFCAPAQDGTTADPAVMQEEGLSFMYMSREEFAAGSYVHKDIFAVYPDKNRNRADMDYLEYVYKPVMSGEKVKGVKSSVAGKAWAVRSMGELYLNRDKINGQGGYVRAFGRGRYRVVFVEAPKNAEQQQALGITSEDDRKLRARATARNQGMSVGVGFGGVSVGMGLGSLRYPVVPIIYDTHQDVLNIFSSDYYDLLYSRHGAQGLPKRAGFIEYYGNDEALELVLVLNEMVEGIDTPAAAE